MNRTKQIGIVLVIVSGMWGCARGPANQQTTVEKLKALETKVAKLEEDFRVSVAAREQLRKKLTATEEERIQLQQQIDQMQAVVKERDVLKQQLALRTTERDSVQVQFDQLRKGIRGLLGQAEPSLTAIPAPVTTAAVTPNSGKS